MCIVLLQLFTAATYHDYLVYLLCYIIQTMAVVKMLSGNSYNACHLSRMMLKNMQLFYRTLLHMRNNRVHWRKRSCRCKVRCYTIVTVDPRSWLYGSHSSHYPNVSWQLGPSTNFVEGSEEYRSYFLAGEGKKRCEKCVREGGREGERR